MWTTRDRKDGNDSATSQKVPMYFGYLLIDGDSNGEVWAVFRSKEHADKVANALNKLRR